MILKQLIIHNIASIRDAEIDFSQKPFDDADVFLISGKTGAGKSTILDAICLALFANTPRLANTQMQGKVADFNDELTVKNPAQLLRRGTGEGFVSLTFTGTNGKSYKASWSIARARKNPEKKLQSKTWELLVQDSGRTLTKDDDISAEMKNAIGLDFTQFCRTTMLAQGDFSKFLNSPDNSKADILEKITGTDIYARIGSKINEITGRKKSDWEKAELLVQGINLLDKEDIELINEKIKALDSNYDLLRKALTTDRRALEWLKTDEKLAKALGDAAERLRKADSDVNSENFLQTVALIKHWNETADVRAGLADRAAIIENLRKKNMELERLKKNYLRLLGAILEKSNRKEKAEKELEKINDFLQGEAARATAYDNAPRIVEALGKLAGYRDRIAQEMKDVDSNEKRITNELNPLLEKRSGEEKSLEEKTASLKSDIAGREEDSDLRELPDLHNRLQSKADFSNAIILTRKMVEGYEKDLANFQKQEKQLREHEAKIEKINSDIAGLTPDTEKAGEDENRLKAVYESQKDTVDKFAVAMRAHLHIGDKCPVCSNTISKAFDSEETLKNIVARYEEDWKEARDRHKKLSDKINELKGLLDGNRKVMLEEKESLEKGRSELESNKGITDKSLEKIGQPPLDGKSLERLENLLRETSDERHSLEQRIRKCEEKESQLADLRKRADKNTTELENIRKAIQKVKDEISQYNNKKDISLGLIETLRTEAASAETNIRNLISGDWETDWEEKPIEFASDLQKKAKKYNDAVKEKENLEKALSQLADIIATATRGGESLLKTMPSWNDLTPQKEESLEDIGAFSSTLVSDVSSVVATIRTLEENIRSKSEVIDKFLKENQEISEDRLRMLASLSQAKITAANEEISRLRNGRVAAESALKEIERQLAAHKEQRPDILEEDTLESISRRITESEEAIKEIGEKKGSLQRNLDEDREKRRNLEDIKKEAEKKKSEYDRWLRLDDRLGSRGGDKFRKIAQSYVLMSLIRSANQFMASLSGRYRLAVKANSFVIYVEDAYQGGELRGASTLSGGETFLVSLALALALSDIGGRLDVNTLFIDEGFGTLSGEPLQNAITTLRTLHRKTGRHVGIISHVEELRERIPVQILVEQDSDSSSSVLRISGS